MIIMLLILCISLIIALSAALIDSFRAGRFKYLTVTDLRKKSKKYSDLHYKAVKRR